MVTQTVQNKNDIKEIKEVLKIHSDHLAIANSEMGCVKNDIAWIKDVLEKVETRTWVILSTIIVGFLINIAFQLWGR